MQICGVMQRGFLRLDGRGVPENSWERAGTCQQRQTDVDVERACGCCGSHHPVELSIVNGAAKSRPSSRSGLHSKISFSVL